MFTMRSNSLKKIHHILQTLQMPGNCPTSLWCGLLQVRIKSKAVVHVFSQHIVFIFVKKIADQAVAQFCIKSTHTSKEEFALLTAASQNFQFSLRRNLLGFCLKQKKTKQLCKMVVLKLSSDEKNTFKTEMRLIVYILLSKVPKQIFHLQ